MVLKAEVSLMLLESAISWEDRIFSAEKLASILLLQHFKMLTGDMRGLVVGFIAARRGGDAV